MATSTLIKVGAVTLALIATGTVWGALRRRRAAARRLQTSSHTTAQTAGKPADAYSRRAIQHDLSVGDAM